MPENSISDESAVMQARSRHPEFVERLFSTISARYDLANHVLSGGLDFLWRRRATRVVRRWSPHRVLDVATGTGDLALALQLACPEAEVIGTDFCEPMLARAREKGLVKTVRADACALPFRDGEFDVVTVAFGLRNMESWSGALLEMARILSAGGHLLILDFSMPAAPLRGVYRLYLHSLLPRLAAFLTQEKSAYAYLGASIEQFPQGDTMCALLLRNGFDEPRCERLSGGIVSLYTARRAPQQL
ncbi:MAG: demethylmenaquinone methyltransferase / 2-methoxy-6-polyprenyl,4-benzoquinol methylase [Chthoniobacter sp.]|jgi:demethylmenaquinone methyltransferase/2-methoxy-6-polyprenyl-1,4-benzoquinol methylase|nr:demethylmenaquinone methyltransferase / 2-methoxy-6-polyprenyl,4-benzoquinol methylase [Chthoniobacter sp.]